MQLTCWEEERSARPDQWPLGISRFGAVLGTAHGQITVGLTTVVGLVAFAADEAGPSAERKMASLPQAGSAETRRARTFL